MGWDPSIVQRGGPSILPLALYFVIPGTNDKALQWFWMNQHSGYLLQREHAAGSDSASTHLPTGLCSVHQEDCTLAL